MTMANTSPVYARIDSSLKDNAETILARLGITPTGAIQMLYSQIKLTRSIPFEIKLPPRMPVALSVLTAEQLEVELQKGVDSVSAGRVRPAGEVDELFRREFGI